jgi:copper chaperone CopZ
LAQDLESKRLFALKKIRCPLGSDSVKTALKEVEGKQTIVFSTSTNSPTQKAHVVDG